MLIIHNPDSRSSFIADCVEAVQTDFGDGSFLRDILFNFSRWKVPHTHACGRPWLYLSIFGHPQFLILSTPMLARAVVRIPKFCHATPILKPPHWFKINERIENKLLSLTYKALDHHRSTYLYAQLDRCSTPRGTRSSFVVTLSRPPTSSLKITNCSFLSALPHLWNQLRVSLRQPCIDTLLMMSRTLIHLPPAHHSHPSLHIHCFIPGSKLNFLYVRFLTYLVS